MAVGGHFKSDLWVLMANNLEHVQTYSILTFSQCVIFTFDTLDFAGEGFSVRLGKVLLMTFLWK